MGIGKTIPIKGVSATIKPACFSGKMSEGKDTTTCHWEIMGIITPEPFPVYSNCFPKEIINTFVKIIVKQILGNKPASGTGIIKEFGKEYLM